MAKKIWKITASTNRMGGGGPPLKQYFLVAIETEADALVALRHRRPDVEESELTVVGEAAADDLEWLDISDHQILSLEPVS
jgi:hypothetical protein